MNLLEKICKLYRDDFDNFPKDMYEYILKEYPNHLSFDFSNEYNDIFININENTNKGTDKLRITFGKLEKGYKVVFHYRGLEIKDIISLEVDDVVNFVKCYKILEEMNQQLYMENLPIHNL